MKRIWNWLFGGHKGEVVYPFREMRFGLRQVITEYRPDLLEEFNQLGPKPMSALGIFLDKHFPRSDMRWGLTSATAVHVNLRHYLEQAK